MTYRMLLLTSVVVLAACNQAEEISGQPANRSEETRPMAASANDSSSDANVSLPDDRTPIEEPSGPIDPKSAEAAGQIVQRFGALVEQERWLEAEALWGDAASATQWTTALKRNREVHLEVGKPGLPEGAAGSIYVTVPIIFYGKNGAGSDFRRAGQVILRRGNDVPGSTEAQRRWRIERIEPGV